MTVIVLWFVRMVPWVGLKYVLVVFPDHTHLVIFSDYNPSKGPYLNILHERDNTPSHSF